MNIIQKIRGKEISLHRITETLAQPTFTVPYLMAIFLVGKFLGFVKIRVIAQLFGVTGQSDIFWAAFTIPDMFFNIIVAGSINAAIIPVFTKVLLGKGDKELSAFFLRINALLSVIFVVFSALVFIFSQQIAEGIVSGGAVAQVLNVSSAFHPEDAVLLASLMRIMLLSPILLGVSSIMSGYLQVYKRFVITATAPLMYNIGTIVGSVVLVNNLDLGVVGASWSVIIGSLMHLLIQLPTFWSISGKYFSDIKALFSFSQAREMLDVIKLSVPRMIGAFGEQINVFITTIISFTVTQGALSAYRYAFSLYLFPPQIISGALSMTTMTKLSELFHNKDFKGFKEVFNKSVQNSIYLIVPFIAIFIVLRLPVVRLAYGAVAFDWRSTILTSWSLVLLSVSMLAFAVMAIVLRAFYATHETKLPLIIAFFSIIVNLVATILFTNFFSHYMDWRPILLQITGQLQSGDFAQTVSSLGSDLIRWFTTRSEQDFAVGGIALGYTISYIFEMTLGLALLNRKIKVVSWVDTIKPALKKLLLGLITTAAMYFVYRLTDKYLDTTRTISVVLVFTWTSAAGAIVYLAFSKIMHINELSLITDKIKILLRKK